MFNFGFPTKHHAEKLMTSLWITIAAVNVDEILAIDEAEDAEMDKCRVALLARESHLIEIGGADWGKLSVESSPSKETFALNSTASASAEWCISHELASDSQGEKRHAAPCGGGDYLYFPVTKLLDSLRLC